MLSAPQSQRCTTKYAVNSVDALTYKVEGNTELSLWPPRTKPQESVTVRTDAMAAIMSTSAAVERQDMTWTDGKPSEVGNRKPTITQSNEVNYFKGKLNVVVWPFITDTNCWFVLTKKSDAAPLSFSRTKLEFDSDGDFDTKDLKVSAYTRYSLGFIDPRFCYGSMGSS